MKTLSPLPPSQLPFDPFLVKHLLVGAQYDTVIDNLPLAVHVEFASPEDQAIIYTHWFDIERMLQDADDYYHQLVAKHQGTLSPNVVSALNVQSIIKAIQA
ncbi:MAG: hypothetical protein D8B54_07665 [Catonella sp.]|nr:MAG: hypothetical protein D8B54_07665 [Catonella sp.]